MLVAVIGVQVEMYTACPGTIVQKDAHTFIIRIWNEKENEEGNSGVWRGTVEQVGHDTRQHFSNITTAMQFIEERSPMKTERSVPGWRKWWTDLRRRLSRKPGKE